MAALCFLAGAVSGLPAQGGSESSEQASASPATAALSHRLQTFIARARGAAIRPGRSYHYSTLTKATQYLQAQLEKKGRLGAQVTLAGADYHADTNRADIHFAVKPGLVSTVAIKGAHLWSWTRKALLPVYQGAGVDEESVEEGRQELISHFQAKGYFDVKVDAQLKTEPGVLDRGCHESF